MRLGVGEILVVLALALLFFGPSKLPQLGASLGQALKSFKVSPSADLLAAVRRRLGSHRCANRIGLRRHCGL